MSKKRSTFRRRRNVSKVQRINRRPEIKDLNAFWMRALARAEGEQPVTRVRRDPPGTKP